MREQDKHFLWSIYAAMAIVFIWRGLWESLYEIPLIGNNPFALFAIGFAMLTLSGVIFKEFDPLGGIEKSINKTLHLVQTHPHKDDFVIKYKDKNQKKEVTIHASRLRSIERGALVVQHHQRKEELFVPTYRVTEILYKGKTYWKL